MAGASSLIAILDELDRPDLIDCILELGHTLAVAGHAKSELRSKGAREGVERMAREGKIRIFAASTAAELSRIKEEFPSLGPGESDTLLLLHERLRSQGRSYCILDGRGARRAAKSLGVPFTGLLGLLGLLKKRGIIDGREAGEIVEDLRRAGFRMPSVGIFSRAAARVRLAVGLRPGQRVEPAKDYQPPEGQDGLPS